MIRPLIITKIKKLSNQRNWRTACQIHAFASNERWPIDEYNQISLMMLGKVEGVHDRNVESISGRRMDLSAFRKPPSE
jgi:hypothetical protein